MELEEIQRRIEAKRHGRVTRNSKWRWEMIFRFQWKRWDVFLKDDRVNVKDIGNQHENAEFGSRIKEELLKDEKEMLKNMSEIRKLDRTRLLCLRKVEKGKLFTEEKWISFYRRLNRKTWQRMMTCSTLELHRWLKYLRRLKQKVRRNSLDGKEDWKVK